jgi:hypothetical protein
MSQIFGNPTIGGGHESNGFGYVEPWDVGVRYNHGSPDYLPPQIDIYAGIDRAVEHVYHYGVPVWLQELIQRQDQPTCIVGCGVPPVVEPIPEPASLGLVLIAVALMVVSQWKVTRR